MLYDFRADFRKGRIGSGFRAKQDTKAYRSGLLDAQNVMVMADGTLARRWGCAPALPASGPVRLEAWEYGTTNTTRFLLAFEAGALTVYDADLTQRGSFTGQPWDADTIWSLQIAPVGEKCVVADAAFTTQQIKFDPNAETFDVKDFWIERTAEKGLGCPFITFPDAAEIGWTLTCYTTSRSSTGDGVAIAKALAIPDGTYDLAAGTGTLTTDADFFTAEHVGWRLGLLDGEVRVNSVTDARNAEVLVKRTVAIKLDTDPFWLRSSSRLVEVAAFEHGLEAGDTVFLYGIPRGLDNTDDILGYAPRIPLADGTATDGKRGDERTYQVSAVADKDHFDVTGEASDTNWLGLQGGSDAYMIPVSAQIGIKEPVFSYSRGWPGVCAFHGSRLWLGGTRELPSALFASKINEFTNFDPGDGSAGDGISLYGIGGNAQLRHVVSDFDLILLTNAGEYYVPGSTEVATTQETARAMSATAYGSAFTSPKKFDGSVFFVDGVGAHMREFSAESRDETYTAPPSTVAVPDWVSEPMHSCVFAGARVDNTPYLLLANHGDGSLLVCHSARENDAFGFTRWTLGTDDTPGKVWSCVGIGTRLFAAVEWNGVHQVVEFDSSKAAAEDLDLYIDVTSPGDGTTDPLPEMFWNQTVQVLSAEGVHETQPVDGAGGITLPVGYTALRLGISSPGNATFTPPVTASPQGTKAGNTLCLVSVKILWNTTATGTVGDEEIVNGFDDELLDPDVKIDEWRTYFVSEWGTEPTAVVSFTGPGRLGIRAATLKSKV